MSENLAKPKGLRRGSCGRRAFEARLRGGTPAPSKRISATAEWAPPLAGRSTASETGSKPIAGSSSVPRRCIPRTFTPFFAATPPLSSDCGRLRAPHQSNLRCLTVRPSWMMSFSEAMPKATCCSAKFLVTILSLSMVLMPSSVIGLSLTRSSAPVGM